jgi:hypothetical protein
VVEPAPPHSSARPPPAGRTKTALATFGGASLASSLVACTTSSGRSISPLATGTSAYPTSSSDLGATTATLDLAPANTNPAASVTCTVTGCGASVAFLTRRKRWNGDPARIVAGASSVTVTGASEGGGLGASSAPAASRAIDSEDTTPTLARCSPPPSPPAPSSVTRRHATSSDAAPPPGAARTNSSPSSRTKKSDAPPSAATARRAPSAATRTTASVRAAWFRALSASNVKACVRYAANDADEAVNGARTSISSAVSAIFRDASAEAGA